MLHCIEWVTDAIQLDTSHSQRLNRGKSPGTNRCEWLWAIAPCL